MPDNHKMNYLEYITKKCSGEEVRAKTGLCMIIFAVPLLIPGITMTAVAFEEETSFSRYSAIHIFGMVLVAIAILLLLAGFLLRVKFITRVAPDDDFHVMSTHVKINKDAHLDADVKVNRRDHKDSDPPAMYNSIIPHVNYLIEQKDYSIAKTDHGVSSTLMVGSSSKIYRDGFQGQSSSMESLADDSSSDESCDSEDYSSASYTITDETTDNKVALRAESQDNAVNTHAADSLYSKSKSEEQRPHFSFRNFRTTLVQTTGFNSNNFFQHSAEGNVQELKELPDTKITLCSQNADVLDGNHDSKNIVVALSQNNEGIVQTDIAQVTKQSFQVQSHEHSPETRQRLQGRSSDALSMSSEVLISPAVTPTDTSLKQSAVSSEENVADSNTSVFSNDKESTTRNKMQNNSTRKVNSSKSSKLSHRRMWAQSPYTTQVFSVQAPGRLSKSTSAVAISQSPHMEHSTRPNSSEGYSCSGKTLVSVTSFDLCLTETRDKRGVDV